MKHLIALSVLLLGGCREKGEVADSVPNGNGNPKVEPVRADSESGEPLTTVVVSRARCSATGLRPLRI